MRALCLTPWASDRQPAVLGVTSLQQTVAGDAHSSALSALQSWSVQTATGGASKRKTVGLSLQDSKRGLQATPLRLNGFSSCPVSTQEFAVVLRERETKEDDEKLEREGTSSDDSEALVLPFLPSAQNGQCSSKRLLPTFLTDDCDDRLVGRGKSSY